MIRKQRVARALKRLKPTTSLQLNAAPPEMPPELIEMLEKALADPNPKIDIDGNPYTDTSGPEWDHVRHLLAVHLRQVPAGSLPVGDGVPDALNNPSRAEMDSFGLHFQKLHPTMPDEEVDAFFAWLNNQPVEHTMTFFRVLASMRGLTPDA